MKKVWIQFACIVAWAALWLPAAEADDPPKKQPSAEADALAKKLITQMRSRQGR
jgi:hypothetical protein